MSLAFHLNSLFVFLFLFLSTSLSLSFSFFLSISMYRFLFLSGRREARALVCSLGNLQSWSGAELSAVRVPFIYLIYFTLFRSAMRPLFTRHSEPEEKVPQRTTKNRVCLVLFVTFLYWLVRVCREILYVLTRYWVSGSPSSVV